MLAGFGDKSENGLEPGFRSNMSFLYGLEYVLMSVFTKNCKTDKQTNKYKTNKPKIQTWYANFILQLRKSNERKNVIVVERLFSTIKMYVFIDISWLFFF